MTEQAIRYTDRTADAIRKADEQLPVAIDLTTKKPDVINNYVTNNTIDFDDYDTLPNPVYVFCKNSNGDVGWVELAPFVCPTSSE